MTARRSGVGGKPVVTRTRSACRGVARSRIPSPHKILPIKASSIYAHASKVSAASRGRRERGGGGLVAPHFSSYLGVVVGDVQVILAEAVGLPLFRLNAHFSSICRSDWQFHLEVNQKKYRVIQIIFTREVTRWPSDVSEPRPGGVPERDSSDERETQRGASRYAVRTHR